MMTLRPVFIALAPLLLGAAAPPGGLDWAYPGPGETVPDTARHHLPGSPRHFTGAALDDMDHAPDWYPRDHPRAPRVVLNHKGGACGYCHLATGAGRTENGQLRGQPVEYIEEQVHAFASDARGSAGRADPTSYMIAAARAVSAADLRAAARYFAALDPVRHARVVEAATIPQAVAQDYQYRFVPGTHEPLGRRIIEGAIDPRAHALRDPRERVIAYVPVGSIARGRTLALHGAGAVPACASCHTAHFIGIGGSSPTFIVRQLAAFRSHARNDPGAAPMQTVAATLTDDQIIDLAAYVGSRPAWTRAQMHAAMNEE